MHGNIYRYFTVYVSVKLSLRILVFMSRKYNIRDQDKFYFVTFTVIHWLDVFIRREYKDIFMGSIKHCQKNKGLELCAYVIMSSHAHLIIGRHGEERGPRDRCALRCRHRSVGRRPVDGIAGEGLELHPAVNRLAGR